VSAEEFARLLNARRVKRGAWVAKCPSHPDRTPSLSIREGKRSPIVFKCMSEGCPPKSILSAMGLRWSDVLEPRAMTPEIRAQLDDKERLRCLELRWGAALLCKVALDPTRSHYWQGAVTRIEDEINSLRDKMDPARARERKIKAAIDKFGWDVIWDKFMATEKGQAVAARWGIAEVCSE
jgi:hypothetical protein